MNPETSNAYSPPALPGTTLAPPHQTTHHRRGPALFLASGGLLGALAAIPLVVAIPISADPNPLGYLFVLLGVPLGGLAYRIRSRNYPVDADVRSRLLRYCGLSLLLPASIAVLTGMRAQGFMMTVVGFAISLSFIFGILLAGSRRQGSGAPSVARGGAVACGFEMDSELPPPSDR